MCSTATLEGCDQMELMSQFAEYERKQKLTKEHISTFNVQHVTGHQTGRTSDNRKGLVYWSLFSDIILVSPQPQGCLYWSLFSHRAAHTGLSSVI